MISIQCAVDSFREAAILPERWQGALQCVAGALRSDAATLVLAPTRALTLVRAQADSVAYSTNIAPIVADYMDSPIADSREPRVTPQLDQGFMTDYAYFSKPEIASDAYYQQFLIPRGLGWNAAAALDDKLIISLKRGTGRGAYDGADLSLLNDALPWLRAASRVACMTWRSGFTGQLSAFARLGRGALLIDRDARILEMNDCVALGDGLDARDGILQASRLADRARLQHFLSDIAGRGNGVNPPATTLMLLRPSGARPWLLDGIPYGDALRSLHCQAAALILVTDVERPLRLSREMLGRVFGLTVTEAKLAGELVLGKSLQHASAQLAISESHARQRLKSIFHKTGTSRQGELIALLAKLH